MITNNEKTTNKVHLPLSVIRCGVLLMVRLSKSLIFGESSFSVNNELLDVNRPSAAFADVRKATANANRLSLFESRLPPCEPFVRLCSTWFAYDESLLFCSFDTLLLFSSCKLEYISFVATRTLLICHIRLPWHRPHWTPGKRSPIRMDSPPIAAKSLPNHCKGDPVSSGHNCCQRCLDFVDSPKCQPFDHRYQDTRAIHRQWMAFLLFA